MNRNIPLVFSMLLLAGIIIPAYAQTSENVVINEVDINPHGSDFASISEYVELYNPTDSDIDQYMTVLCRCGTYIRIRAAIKTAASMMKKKR